MNKSSKWMATLSTDNYEWIKETAEEANITGSQVIQEMIALVRRDMEKRFRDGLVEAQLRLRREALEEKRRQLDEEIKQLESNRRVKQPA